MAEPILQLIVLFGMTLGMAIIFGRYIARMIAYEDRPLEKTLGRIENGFYRIIGVEKDRQMTWKEYFVALVLTNAIVAVLVFFALLFQDLVPFATHGMKGFSVDLAFHTAAAFITNTDIQHYAGDQSMTVFSQTIVLMFTMFVAPASAIAAAFAFIRGFIRKNFGLGNFYVDFTRIILTLLLPVAFFSAILLMALGLPQTLAASATVTTLEGREQTINMGPIASFESIKLLGSNGGGYFGANSGHPFENPNGLSNIYEIFLMLVIPLSFPIAYGRLLGRGRGVSILIVMLISFGALLGIGLLKDSGPALLETRFGSFGSVLFNISSISTNTGAANSALAGMSPNAVVSLFLAMFVQAIPGADGTGMMTMVVYVILSLFIVGLMVGKTPEFMSMKISPKDVKLGVFIFLVHPALILIPTAIAYTTGDAHAVVGEQAAKPFGYTQTLYEYTSAAANNGSDYLGTSANTPFWNYSTGIVMLLGRYIPIGLMLIIAGSFTVKDRKEVIEPIRTQGPLFIAILLIMTFLLTALTFFPFLAIGPFSM